MSNRLRTLTLAGRLAAACGAMIFCTSALAAQQKPPTRIAVVDLEYVFAQSKSGQKLTERLDAFQQQVQAEGEGMAAKARQIQTRVKQAGGTLSQEKLAELQKEYEDETTKIRRFRDDKQREGEKMRNEGLAEIEKELEPLFLQIRDEGDYDIILNNVPGVVVMTRESVDITQMVVDRLNAGP